MELTQEDSEDCVHCGWDGLLEIVPDGAALWPAERNGKIYWTCWRCRSMFDESAPNGNHMV